MASLNAKFEIPYINEAALNKDLIIEGRKIVREAARRWLVAVLRRIPVRTGFLQGSFGGLENIVGNVDKQTGSITLIQNALRSREARIEITKSNLEKQQKEKINIQARLRTIKKSTPAQIQKGIKKKLMIEKIEAIRAKKEAVLSTKIDKLKEKVDRSKSILKGRLKIHSAWLERKIPARATVVGEYYHPPGGGKVLKTPTSGIPFATPEADIFPEEIGSLNVNGTSIPLGSTSVPNNVDLTIENKKALFYFKFNVNISYYDINDLYNRTLIPSKNEVVRTSRQQNIPWFSQAAGHSAFMQYLRSVSSLETLKNIKKYMVTRTITLRGESRTESTTMG